MSQACLTSQFDELGGVLNFECSLAHLGGGGLGGRIIRRQIRSVTVRMGKLKRVLFSRTVLPIRLPEDLLRGDADGGCLGNRFGTGTPLPLRTLKSKRYITI